MAERFAILCTAVDWAAPPRTAAICIVAPQGSYAGLTRYKVADLVISAAELFRTMPSVLRALAEDFGAYAVFPGDDLAFAALAKFVERMDGLEISEATRTMVTRSMPAAPAARLLASDSNFIVAQQQRPLCPAPPCVPNPTVLEAEAFAAAHGYPLVVKRDGFASGHGVSVCRDPDSLMRALAKTPSHARNATFVLQKFIPGTVYGATVSGVHGRALAGFSFVKHRCSTENGATSVALHDDRDDILHHAFELFAEYGLNGFSGFDYIVDPDGETFFIEINPRLMPTGHLTCFGIDLVAIFMAGVRGQKAPASEPRTHQYAALFPNEWARDSESPHLRTAFHDVPWHDPPVLAAMIDRTLAAQTGPSGAFTMKV
jgi:biotin carboxylase